MILLLCFFAVTILPFTSCDITSSAVSSLIQKYSTSSEYIAGSQLQTFLDKINKCIKCDSNAEIKDSGHCLSAKQFFQSLNINNGALNVSGFLQLCPLVLESIDKAHCSDDSFHKNTAVAENDGKPSTVEVWGFGLLFVTIISLCSLVGVAVVPLMKKEFYNQLLMTLVGLAVGSLSSSAIFHLIPQAYGIVDSDDEHGYLTHSFMMVAGIWVFFLTERILSSISIFRNKKCDKLNNSKESAVNVLSISDPTSDHILLDKNGSIKEQKHGHDHMLDFDNGINNSIATVAWMIIFGDGFHNFIDGLSIGAAFNESLLTGVSISLAVLCEELPHELGDIAVLLNSGMGMKQALLYNFLSACTCYFGLVLGILLGKVQASTYVFGFAAGMFLYISLVDMVPKMNEMAEEACHISVKKAAHTLFLQNLGIAIGVISLFLLAKYQSYFDFS